MALLFTSAPDGFAQERVSPGARVRVAVRPTPGLLTRDRIIGLLVNLDGDSVVVRERADRPELAFPLEAVTSFEVSRGRKSSAGKGALIGLVSGAVGGVAAGQIVCNDGQCRSGSTDYAGFVSGVIGLGGALFGAGVGALVGGRFHHDKWEWIPLRDLRGGLDPWGPGIRLSTAF